MRPVTPELLEEVTRRLVKELDPEEIILFGSYAWGTPHKDSDIDLFIIVPDGIPSFNCIDWEVRADLCLDDQAIATDILVETGSRVERARTVYGPLERKIFDDGKALYQKSSVQNVVSEFCPQEEKYKLVRWWLTRSQENQKAAEILADSPEPLHDAAIFYCWQGV